MAALSKRQAFTGPKSLLPQLPSECLFKALQQRLLLLLVIGSSVDRFQKKIITLLKVRESVGPLGSWEKIIHVIAPG